MGPADTFSEPPRTLAARRPGERLERAVALAVVGVPALGTAAALALAWVQPPSALDLGLLAGLYVLTMLGITAGFHRLATHRAFEAVAPVRVALLALGSMAAQGPLLFWAAAHRRHHQHGDRPGDPHTPHGPGGLLHAHVGWMLRHGLDD
jgi:stearoyl-CoA desaturase (delta-9 desaturase)